MSNQAEQVLDRHEASIKEIRDLFFESESTRKVFMNDVKHLMEAVKGNVESIKAMHEILSSHTTSIGSLSSSEKDRQERWDTLKSQWAKIIGVSITLATIFAASFEIIKQPLH